ncbi:MAG: 2-hydroxyacid dehydrogenase [Negativicutes bacterium]|nr:2-hydroxyacid dehydrogenase [Negativicutes bacterium]
MGKKLKTILLGDAMIVGSEFKAAADKFLGDFVEDAKVGDWEPNWQQLQARRLEVEKKGPEIETVDALILEHGQAAEMLAGLFVPISSKVFDAMPKLRIAGVSRAGLENVNVEEATKRGIVVFNIEGRNAEAVSDFAVGLMLSECRNIARAHYAIKNGQWRKEFSNSDWVPELKGKKIGIVGFGYIGRLLAEKLSGFGVNRLVYDPFVDADAVREAGCVLVDKETLFKESDFISLHARMSESTKNMVGAKELALMKPTSYLINTARAGLVDEQALIEALKAKKIAGAGLDVFGFEPIKPDNELLTLDNVTLTTHIAGTTREALTRSPEILMEDIYKLLSGGKPRFVINREVLERPEFKTWLAGVRG